MLKTLFGAATFTLAATTVGFTCKHVVQQREKERCKQAKETLILFNKEKRDFAGERRYTSLHRYVHPESK